MPPPAPPRPARSPPPRLLRRAPPPEKGHRQEERAPKRARPRGARAAPRRCNHRPRLSLAAPLGHQGAFTEFLEAYQSGRFSPRLAPDRPARHRQVRLRPSTAHGCSSAEKRRWLTKSTRAAECWPRAAIPDLHWVDTKDEEGKDKGLIEIEKIRRLNSGLRLTSTHAAWRVVVIDFRRRPSTATPPTPCSRSWRSRPSAPPSSCRANAAARVPGDLPLALPPPALRSALFR